MASCFKFLPLSLEKIVGKKKTKNMVCSLVSVKPENVVLIVNDSNIPLCVGVVISLSCSAVGDPVVSYRLFENDVLVSNSSSPIVWSKLASTEGVLVYRCVAYNTVGTSNTTASVTVNGKQTFSFKFLNCTHLTKFNVKQIIVTLHECKIIIVTFFFHYMYFVHVSL